MLKHVPQQDGTEVALTLWDKNGKACRDVKYKCWITMGGPRRYRLYDYEGILEEFDVDNGEFSSKGLLPNYIIILKVQNSKVSHAPPPSSLPLRCASVAAPLGHAPSTGCL
jgi:hypothetical protein